MQVVDTHTGVAYISGRLPGLPGLRSIAVLPDDTHISRWVREAARLDHDQSALPRVGQYLMPTSVVYDVGAFIGDHTAYYASHVKRVVAFEANWRALQCLHHNVMEYDNVEVFAMAVGNGEGVGMVVCDQNAGASYLHPSPVGLPTLRLDDLPYNVPPPTLIKLDIEGWETRALHGAGNMLVTHHPTLVIEVNRGALERAGSSPAELRETVWSYGYRRLQDLYTTAPWEAADPRPQFDVVCLP